MAGNTKVEINALVDSRRLSPFHLFVVILGCLTLTVDAMDLSAVNVAAPQILKALGADRGAMGNVFGSGNFGILIGTLTLSFVGDIFGRRVGVILSVLAYSLPAVAVAYATQMDHLIYLRFLAGLGIGGVIPNVVALLNETAPKKYRATFVMLAFTGYSLGSSISGWVASQFSPHYGWQSPFVVAGASGMVLAILLLVLLPESVRFLALKEPNSERMRAMVRCIAPDLPISPTTEFIITVPPASKYSIGQLFAGDRRVVTPLLWLAYFAESLTFMTLLSWMTTMLTDAGVPQAQASLAYAWGAFGGLCLMVILAPVIDRIGQLATVGTALIAMVAIVLLGADVTNDMHIAMAILAFATGQVTHNSLNATVAIFYPTNIRAKGIGWATGCGRVALMLGPMVTGYLLAAKLPTAQLVKLIAAPYTVVTCTCVILGLLYRARLRARPPGDGSVQTSPPIELAAAG